MVGLLVRPSLGWLVSHVVEFFAEKLSKPYYCSFPPVRDGCCLVYGFLAVFLMHYGPMDGKTGKASIEMRGRIKTGKKMRGKTERSDEN